MEGTSGISKGDSIIELETLIHHNLGLAAGRRRQRADFTIFRVPTRILQYGDMSAYEPKIVSIGPYHRGKKHLKLMDEFKYEYLHKILQRNPDRTVGNYINKMEELEDSARNCYSEANSMNSGEFVEMLLLDSCFIVELLMLEAEKFEYHPMEGTAWIENSIVTDLLMLENQLPFFVLQSMYDLVVVADQDRTTTNLTELAIGFFTFASPNGRMSLRTEDLVPDHLLHLFACSSIHQKSMGNNSEHQNQCNLLSRYISFNTIETFCGLFFCCLVLFLRNSEEKKARTAKELEETGVRFKVKRHGSLPNNIAFNDGILEMLPLYCYDRSVVIFKNLIALEQCNWRKYRLNFTHYFHFIDELIDTSNDVELLVQNGILVNQLGSNEEVAQVVNKLCTGITGVIGQDPLATISEELHSFCNSRWPRWRAKLYRDYFNNPWAILSLVAAVALLLLTITQTVFTILQYKDSKPEPKSN